MFFLTATESFLLTDLTISSLTQPVNLYAPRIFFKSSLFIRDALPSFPFFPITFPVEGQYDYGCERNPFFWE